MKIFNFIKTTNAWIVGILTVITLFAGLTFAQSQVGKEFRASLFTSKIQTANPDSAPSGHYYSFAKSDGYHYIDSSGTVLDFLDSSDWAAPSAAIGSTTPVAITATRLVTGVSALTSSATIALASTTANVFTLTPGESATINATTVGLAGQRISLIITTSGTSSYTLTFGTNFKTTGTLATGTTTAKVFVIEFVSNGTNYNECSRTTAM